MGAPGPDGTGHVRPTRRQTKPNKTNGTQRTDNSHRSAASRRATPSNHMEPADPATRPARLIYAPDRVVPDSVSGTESAGRRAQWARRQIHRPESRESERTEAPWADDHACDPCAETIDRVCLLPPTRDQPLVAPTRPASSSAAASSLPAAGEARPDYMASRRSRTTEPHGSSWPDDAGGAPTPHAPRPRPAGDVSSEMDLRSRRAVTEQRSQGRGCTGEDQQQRTGGRSIRHHPGCR